MTIYRGRFAPSPTGPLHLGSLFAALISYLEARSHNGEWLLRIEDVDAQREQTGARQSIIDTLEAHSLCWDGDISYQSDQSQYYERVLQQLADQKRTYHCPCSRKQLLSHKGLHLEGCQNKTLDKHDLANCAIKFKMQETQFSWNDGILGKINLRCQEDFVLKRKEGFYAYQLAVVCDDIIQNITHVVRGSDLLDSTPMQLTLYHALNTTAPEFSHFPVLLNKKNQKLSKQTFARAVEQQTALKNLLDLFTLLKLPLSHTPKSCEQALQMALEIWNQDYIPVTKTLNPTFNA